MARRNRRGQGGAPLPLLLCGLLVILLRFFPGPADTAMPDLPAADEPAAIPLPREEVPVRESAALAPLPTQPAAAPIQPVYVADVAEYRSGGPIYYKNETDYAIDLPSLLRRDSPVTLGGEGVQVLIMHTHGTEAYTPSEAHPYTPSGEYRTTDSDANMLRVGREIADILNSRGVAAVHSTTLNDYPAYNGSYNRALKDIQHYVAQYPTVRLVIDVHRDAIAAGDSYYKTAAEVDGQQTAQLMFVTGTDAGGLSHPDWRDNLTFQAQLHDRLNSLYPGIMRPMSIRASRFNQHVRTGSMLVEVGACGNTLEEALAAARIFADTLADVLLAQ
ncbi:MAG: stage II sporulation protein P [Clostridia bacterium]|nr:stage II sporulation protein P [Clostridia bacterium]